MKIQFKGGCREVGRSAVFLDEKILIDYGMKPGESPLYPLNGMHPKTVLVSHGHLDHCGAVPNLMDLDPEIYMTPPTADFANMLAKDTLKIAQANGVYAPYNSEDLRKFVQRTTKIDTGVQFTTQGYNVEFYDAGHIPGAASIHIESKNGESLFYTGDISTTNTRLVSGAGDFPTADSLVIESTYFGEEHPARKEVESAFMDSLHETLDIGGTVIIPAFAIGRTQEILMLLDSHGIHPYVDGMGTMAYKLMMHHTDYLRNHTHLKKAYKNAVIVKGRKRDSIPLDSSIIITTAGMLNGGPVLHYIDKLYNDPKSKIMLSGYQVEGTNGKMAIDKGIIDNDGIIRNLHIKVEQYDFSAHCGDKELKDIVKEFCDTGTEKVFVMHGDNTEMFAEWVLQEIGVEAHAPVNGDEFLL
ncbi:MAG: MBL fold metallo-hydrolase [Methanosarcinaceae archaeon]